MTLGDLEYLLHAGKPSVLVSLLASAGSSPRHAGSLMLVGSDGSQYGSIGGGEFEAKAMQLARLALTTGQSYLYGESPVGSTAGGAGQICGGASRLLVEYISDQAVYARAIEQLSAGTAALLVKELTLVHGLAETDPALRRVTVVASLRQPETVDKVGDRASDMETVRAGSSAGQRRVTAWFDERTLSFYQTLPASEHLLILGAGHVGQAVARQAQGLGFAVTVADDRAAILAEADLPPGTKRLTGGLDRLIARFRFTPATYIVVATRSHALDFECCALVLKQPHRYVGLVGSAAKTRQLVGNLQAAGFDPATIAGLFAPIGLDIGAETPQEIAVAIVAEIIACRYGRMTVSLRQ